MSRMFSTSHTSCAICFGGSLPHDACFAGPWSASFVLLSHRQSSCGCSLVHSFRHIMLEALSGKRLLSLGAGRGLTRSPCVARLQGSHVVPKLTQCRTYCVSHGPVPEARAIPHSVAELVDHRTKLKSRQQGLLSLSLREVRPFTVQFLIFLCHHRLF